MSADYFGSALRRRIIFFIIIGMVAVQTMQLINMQLLESNKYEVKSHDNSIKSFTINAPRGIIFDRNIEILVGNKASFTILLTPSEYDRENSKILETVLGVELGYIDKILKKYKKFSKYKPRTLLSGADYRMISWIEENQQKLSGISYQVDTQRDYSFGIIGSHIFGYTKEIGREALKKKKETYSIGDNVGFIGLEKSYETLLRGEKGKEYFVANSRQKIVKRYNEGENDIPPIKGNDIITTIDYKTQKMAEELFTNIKGSVVAIEPATGEILAYVSAPQYDLSSFADVTSNLVWDSLRFDEGKPLFNRGTISMYPPGSTYKMIIAIAALEEGVISTSKKVNCNGGFYFGNRFFKCTHYHGKVDMKEAIEQSCNTYFYKLILKVGLQNFHKYSTMFGFGERTGIDISPESKGNVPSKEYYDRVYGKGKWTDGYLLNIGIGQGELVTTPIQLVQYTSLMANWGETKIPHFVKGYIDSNTNEFVSLKYDSVKINVSNNTLKIIRDAMLDVVNSKDGTARNIRMKEISISGKTGTAQNPHGEDHSIFIAFAPFDNPKIAVAAIVENVGYGSTYAAPIAQKIIKAYLGSGDKSEIEFTNSNLKEVF
ncbi:MAG: penicillin-binding protein 2 [Melioribacteraceae bacterium]|nr:penicillin-binding protein 2 [Melioribacteraceae bacterium]